MQPRVAGLQSAVVGVLDKVCFHLLGQVDHEQDEQQRAQHDAGGEFRWTLSGRLGTKQTGFV